MRDSGCTSSLNFPGSFLGKAIYLSFFWLFTHFEIHRSDQFIDQRSEIVFHLRLQFNQLKKYHHLAGQADILKLCTDPIQAIVNRKKGIRNLLQDFNLSYFSNTSQQPLNTGINILSIKSQIAHPALGSGVRLRQFIISLGCLMANTFDHDPILSIEAEDFGTECHHLIEYDRSTDISLVWRLRCIRFWRV